jgi:2-polyprenyl-3-methyl-5-hydroxy-6-metoxy-1,4-benzoquinol methylase
MSNYKYPNNSRQEMTEFLPDRYETVLEIGCGTGGFKETLGEYFKELYGVEPNDSAAKIARSKGYVVLTGPYEEIESQLPDNFFDLVICNDVIEHMTDHEKFLIQIKKKMKPNGVLVGSVPNIRNYSVLYDLIIKKQWQYTEDGILDRTHLRFFTEKSLRSCLENCGYNIEKLGGINSAAKYWGTIKSAIKVILLKLPFNCISDIRFVQLAFRIKKM